MKNINDLVSGYNTTHIALGAGKNNDCYSISSIFRQNIQDNSLIAIHTVVKNWHCPIKQDGTKYKEGVRFKEEFSTGTYKECLEFINNILEIINAEECDTYLYEYFGKGLYKIVYNNNKDFKQEKVLYKGKSVNDVIQWCKDNGYETQYKSDNPYGSWKLKEQA